MKFGREIKREREENWREREKKKKNGTVV